MQFYVSNLFHLLFPILLTDDLHRAFNWSFRERDLHLLETLNTFTFSPHSDELGEGAGGSKKEMFICCIKDLEGSGSLFISTYSIVVAHYRQRYFCLLVVVFDQL